MTTVIDKGPKFPIQNNLTNETQEMNGSGRPGSNTNNSQQSKSSRQTRPTQHNSKGQRSSKELKDNNTEINVRTSRNYRDSRVSLLSDQSDLTHYTESKELEDESSRRSSNVTSITRLEQTSNTGDFFQRISAAAKEIKNNIKKDPSGLTPISNAWATYNQAKELIESHSEYSETGVDFVEFMSQYATDVANVKKFFNETLNKFDLTNDDDRAYIEDFTLAIEFAATKLAKNNSDNVDEMSLLPKNLGQGQSPQHPQHPQQTLQFQPQLHQFQPQQGLTNTQNVPTPILPNNRVMVSLNDINQGCLQNLKMAGYPDPCADTEYSTRLRNEIQNRLERLQQDRQQFNKNEPFDEKELDENEKNKFIDTSLKLINLASIDGKENDYINLFGKLATLDPSLSVCDQVDIILSCSGAIASTLPQFFANTENVPRSGSGNNEIQGTGIEIEPEQEDNIDPSSKQKNELEDEDVRLTGKIPRLGQDSQERVKLNKALEEFRSQVQKRKLIKSEGFSKIFENAMKQEFSSDHSPEFSGMRKSSVLSALRKHLDGPKFSSAPTIETVRESVGNFPQKDNVAIKLLESANAAFEKGFNAVKPVNEAFRKVEDGITKYKRQLAEKKDREEVFFEELKKNLSKSWVEFVGSKNLDVKVDRFIAQVKRRNAKPESLLTIFPAFQSDPPKMVALLKQTGQAIDIAWKEVEQEKVDGISDRASMEVKKPEDKKPEETSKPKVGPVKPDKHKKNSGRGGFFNTIKNPFSKKSNKNKEQEAKKNEQQGGRKGSVGISLNQWNPNPLFKMPTSDPKLNSGSKPGSELKLGIGLQSTVVSEPELKPDLRLDPKPKVKSDPERQPQLTVVEKTQENLQPIFPKDPEAPRQGNVPEVKEEPREKSSIINNKSEKENKKDDGQDLPMSESTIEVEPTTVVGRSVGSLARSWIGRGKKNPESLKKLVPSNPPKVAGGVRQSQSPLPMSPLGKDKLSIKSNSDISERKVDGSTLVSDILGESRENQFSAIRKTVDFIEQCEAGGDRNSVEMTEAYMLSRELLINFTIHSDVKLRLAASDALLTLMMHPNEKIAEDTTHLVLEMLHIRASEGGPRKVLYLSKDLDPEQAGVGIYAATLRYMKTRKIDNSLVEKLCTDQLQAALNNYNKKAGVEITVPEDFKGEWTISQQEETFLESVLGEPKGVKQDIEVVNAANGVLDWKGLNERIEKEKIGECFDFIVNKNNVVGEERYGTVYKNSDKEIVVLLPEAADVNIAESLEKSGRTVNVVTITLGSKESNVSSEFSNELIKDPNDPKKNNSVPNNDSKVPEKQQEGYSAYLKSYFAEGQKLESKKFSSWFEQKRKATSRKRNIFGRHLAFTDSLRAGEEMISEDSAHSLAIKKRIRQSLLLDVKTGK